MTIAEAIRQAAERLTATSDTARLDAELLMAHALGVSRSDMLLRHMQDTVPVEFAGYVDRRASHEPVAHIVGSQEFFGLQFRVTPDVLIPRSDSEVLVEAALEVAGEFGQVADLGTGSGALLLAFLANKPYWSGIGIDASGAALEVAMQNARRLDLDTRCKMHHLSWRKAGWTDNLGQFALILCNPPYVEDDAELDLDVRDFEPAEALFSGTEGLNDYRVLIPQLDQILAPQGTAIFEIGHKQGPSVVDFAASNGFYCEIRQDLGFRDRVAILTRGVGKARQSG